MADRRGAGRFITGSIAAAMLNLRDRLEPRRVIAGSAIAAAPHLVRGLGDVPWPATILTTSVTREGSLQAGVG
jgi:hypothetical protein